MNGGSKLGVKKERTDEETKQALDYLLRDDFIAGPVSEEGNMAPVHLPLCVIEDVKPAIKDDPELVDVEMTEEVKVKLEEASLKIPSKAKLTQETCQHMFSSLKSGDPNHMVFVQFPDVMPGVPASYGNEEDAKSSNKDQKEASKKIGASPLSGFSEGHMGKLVIRKSGRTSLMLGNVVLDVSMGTKCGFLQDVVSIHPDSGGGGDLSVLGHVSHRLICTPDFDSLLRAKQA